MGSKPIHVMSDEIAAAAAPGGLLHRLPPADGAEAARGDVVTREARDRDGEVYNGKSRQPHRRQMIEAFKKAKRQDGLYRAPAGGDRIRG
jgi:hypothetical protein